MSKACDSHVSSGSSAALIPPCAAFECERTGWTLQMIPTEMPCSAAARGGSLAGQTGSDHENVMVWSARHGR